MNSKQIIDVEEKKVKLLIFTLSGAYHAFYGGDAKEILPVSRIFPVPGSPDYIPGVVNVRGDIQPVIDIHMFMGLKKSEANRIIIVEKQGIHTGILVDSVVDVIDVPVGSIQQSQGNDGTAGKTSYLKHAVTLLSLDKLFGKIASEHMSPDFQTAENSPTETLQLLIFNMADSLFGVDVEQVEEIIDPPPGVAMEELPAFHKILSFCKTGVTYRDPKILFIKHDDNACPIKVDAAKSMVDISINAIQPLPPLLAGNRKSEAVWGATFINGDLVLLVDLYKVSLPRLI